MSAAAFAAGEPSGGQGTRRRAEHAAVGVRATLPVNGGTSATVPAKRVLGSPVAPGQGGQGRHQQWGGEGGAGAAGGLCCPGCDSECPEARSPSHVTDPWDRPGPAACGLVTAGW